MRQVVAEIEGKFVFGLSYDLSKKPGGLVCIVPKRILENFGSAENVQISDVDKAVWVEVEGNTVDQIKKEFLETKKEFIKRFEAHLKRKGIA